MTLTINGECQSFAPAPETVAELIKTLDLDEKPVLVEHNGTALFPREFTKTALTDLDKLEIIQIAAGG